MKSPIKAGLRITLIGLLLIIPMIGCVAGNRPSFVSTGSEAAGKTFYLDGAGNLGFGKESVPLGLADAGYRGQVEHFIWTTYMGIIMDQVSVRHNRREADDLARRIEKYRRRYPDGQVNIIALSAGTGVAVFALESLPLDCQVDNVVLLSSSLSAGYDLTRALRRVSGRIYFFWSPSDPILRRIVPVLGTVDRAKRGTQPAGTYGAYLPRSASNETKLLYRKKVHNRQWDPTESGSFITLRHAGGTSRDAVHQLVAPIIVDKPPHKPVWQNETAPAATASSPTSQPEASERKEPPPEIAVP